MMAIAQPVRLLDAVMAGEEKIHIAAGFAARPFPAAGRSVTIATGITKEF
jgi:hypothetical protein